MAHRVNDVCEGGASVPDLDGLSHKRLQGDMITENRTHIRFCELSRSVRSRQFRYLHLMIWIHLSISCGVRHAAVKLGSTEVLSNWDTLEKSDGLVCIVLVHQPLQPFNYPFFDAQLNPT